MREVKMRNRRIWLRRYNVMFLIAMAGLLLCFVPFGRVMISSVDGVTQHYTLFRYVRSVVRDLLAGNGFKMVNLQLGQGLDVIGTLSYYGLLDPVNLLAACVPDAAMEWAYGAAILLRIYLAGLFFLLYLRKIRLKDDWALPIAALMYAFCGYYTKATLRHPYFADGGIYLALLLIATERLFAQRKWLMFTLVAALMLVANYYFAFQTTLLVVAYILVRLIGRLKRCGVRRCAEDGFALAGAYLLGVALSAVFFLPILRAFMNNARIGAVGGYTDSLIHYSLSYYLSLVLYFCAPYLTSDAWMIENLCPLALFSLMVLFMRQRGKEELRVAEDFPVGQLRACVLLVALFACVPAFGRLFNGWGYASNRWCYGFAFAMCVTVAWAMPRLFSLQGRAKRPLLWLSLAFAALLLAAGVVLRELFLLAGAATVSVFALFFACKDRVAHIRPEAEKRLLAALTLACCVLYCWTLYAPIDRGLSKEYGVGGLDVRIANETAAVAGALDGDGFFRVDTGRNTACHQIMQDYCDPSYYWSVIPNEMYRYYSAMGVSTLTKAFQLYGLGGSSALNALASVACSVRGPGENEVVPYGFEEAQSVTQDDGDVVAVYRNRYALPLGYVYHNSVDPAAFEEMNPVDRQAALMCGALLEGGDCGLPAISDAPRAKSLEWNVAEASGVRLEDGCIAAEAGGTLRLHFAGEPDSETFLVIEGAVNDDADFETDVRMQISSAAGENSAVVLHRSSNFIFPQQWISICLGYSDEGLAECTLRFERSGRFRFDSIHLYSLPMAGYRAAAEALQSEGLRDVEIENNRIRGSVETGAPGVLQISVPYGDGWSVKVDGEQREVLHSGGMYMGVYLDAGTHQVEWTYCTPGLKVGAVISCAAALFAAALWLLQRHRRAK